MVYFWAVLAVLSVGINVFLILYIRENLNFLKTVRDEMYFVSGVVGEFAEHLDKVYGLDTFYGDSTLEGLLKHVNDTSEDLKKGRETLDEYFNA
tara:strand:+ start:1008 stop:1289 length:282 start_codon:yes stop_codon:yes gene_type:complete